MAEKKQNGHYITADESREIARSNAREIKALQKRRAAFTREDYVTEMKDPDNIVEFDDLHTYFYTDNGVVKAVNGVSFNIPRGSTVGVVGESGCGKSVTSLSLMQLVQGPMGQIVSGSIRFCSTVKTPVGKEPIMETVTDENGNEVTRQSVDHKGKPRFKTVFEEHDEVVDIAKMPLSEMSHIRGSEISMIFQEPMTSLNPVFTIGNQLDEVTLLHVDGADKLLAKEKSLEMLRLVGIAMPDHVYNCYPHELSGGMRQRVMIAMALCCNPKLIIADEPTTALDVTIQAQIFDLLRDVKQKISGSIMLITHDLGVVAQLCDEIIVMYAGSICEQGTADEIFYNPCHEYTKGLLRSIPTADTAGTKLQPITGTPIDLLNMPAGCPFAPRCDAAMKICIKQRAERECINDSHYAACWMNVKKAYEEEKKGDEANG